MTRPLQASELEARTREAHSQGSRDWDRFITLIGEFHALSNNGDFSDAEDAREEAAMQLESAFDSFTRGYHAHAQRQGRE